MASHVWHLLKEPNYDEVQECILSVPIKETYAPLTSPIVHNVYNVSPYILRQSGAISEGGVQIFHLVRTIFEKKLSSG